MACTSGPTSARTRARTDARGDARSARGLGWLAVAAVAGLVHAGFGAYWALGGTWLLETVGEQIVAAFSGALWIIGLVALAKLLAAILPLAVEAVRSTPGWLRTAIRLVSWLGALGIILWGGCGMIAAQLALAGAFGTVADTSIPSLIGHAWIWDPLFLVWGPALLIGLIRGRGPRLAGDLQPDGPESQPRPRPVSYRRPSAPDQPAQEGRSPMPKVLHVVTNIDRYPDGTPTGLWLSELVHAYDALEEAGVEQLIASPTGGAVPIEPRSLLPVVCDAATRARHEDPFFMSLLEHSASLAELEAADFDAISLTGGHGVMVDFPASEDLARLVAEIDRKGGVVAAVCHGPAGLLGARAEDGLPFVHGREVTGFSWREEVVAGVSKHVPFSLEDELRELGAEYGRSPVPMAPHVVVDGRLITGQNPTSAKGVASRLLEQLGAVAPATSGGALGLVDSARGRRLPPVVGVAALAGVLGAIALAVRAGGRR